MTGRKPRVRKGQGRVALRRAEFEGRFAERFYDPAFDVSLLGADLVTPEPALLLA